MQILPRAERVELRGLLPCQNAERQNQANGRDGGFKWATSAWPRRGFLSRVPLLTGRPVGDVGTNDPVVVVVESRAPYHCLNCRQSPVGRSVPQQTKLEVKALFIVGNRSRREREREREEPN